VRYFKYAIGSFAVTYIVLVAFVCFTRLDFVMLNVTDWDEFGRAMYLAAAMSVLAYIGFMES
jgi:hypothetical protein